jgi:hypothetical protein
VTWLHDASVGIASHLDGIFSQHGAMQFDGGEVQVLGNVRVLERRCFVYSFPLQQHRVRNFMQKTAVIGAPNDLNPLGSKAAAGNCRATSEE